MNKSTREFLKNTYNLTDDVLDLSSKIEEDLQSDFKRIDEMKEINQYKVLSAMQKSRLSDIHFNWTTGYGYNDVGREKVEEIYSEIFKTEDALVRPIIVNGTHALTLCLSGILRPNDELLSITAHPYDTLHEVIGIKDSPLSLKSYGIKYASVDFTESGDIDLDAVKDKINENTKMIYIQRSKGYSWRKSLTIKEIKEAITFVKNINPNLIVMVDNCYGEFIEDKEPTEVGADIMAGSLIKNPGGGIALTGGYIVGKHELVELVAQRLTSPGIGKECGLTFGTTRLTLQGLFLAPMVVSNALKGAIYCSGLFESLGYDVLPKPSDPRSDIIQAVKLNSEKEIIAFCKGVQKAAPVDSFVSPEPWDMPGYDSPVIMAAGAFVQGSSIELSADSPIREPFTVYFQGGLTYEHSKIGSLLALQEMQNFYV